jgi:ribosomal protein L11 methyltransferase
MRSFPAIELRWPAPPDEAALERVLAELDEAHPTAVEETGSGVRVFFGNSSERARAHDLARAAAPDIAITSLDVPDEQWAERSQAMLTPVRVGRFVVSPPWHADDPMEPDVERLIVQPSMGFGTGHHASTRLCLRLLQDVSLDRRSVLDVGTGSGILAMAAARLGASAVVAIDADADALISARENLELNDLTGAVDVRLVDLAAPATIPGQPFAVVLANLTGGMLRREARVLAGLVGAGGALITSGFQDEEVDEVVAAFAAAGLTQVARADDERWVAMQFKLEVRS